MSHEVDTMAYVIEGGDPWHLAYTKDRSVGVPQSEATPQRMREAAKMLWEPRKVQLSYNWNNEWRPAVQSKDEDTPGRTRNSAYAMIRSDTGDYLASVGKRYTEFFNESLFTLAEELAGLGARLDTCGSLCRGTRVFALLSAGESFEARKGDVLKPYLLLHNTHDGMHRLRGRYTTIRVVCANTESIALSGSALEWTQPHTSSIRRESLAVDAAEVLGLAIRATEESKQVAQTLAQTSSTQRDAGLFFAQLLTDTDSPEEAQARVAEITEKGGRAETILANKGDELMRLRHYGQGNNGTTVWDDFNAVTEFIDYQRARAGNWKKQRSSLSLDGLNAAQFGSGNAMKERALKLALTRVAA